MFKNIQVTFYILHVRKGTASGISSDISNKDGNACPIYNGTLKSFVWSCMSQILMWIVFNCGFSNKITSALLVAGKRFYGYLCESGFAIFEWRVTWNYAYSPLKHEFIPEEYQLGTELNFLKENRKRLLQRVVHVSPSQFYSPRYSIF